MSSSVSEENLRMRERLNECNRAKEILLKTVQALADTAKMNALRTFVPFQVEASIAEIDAQLRTTIANIDEEVLAIKKKIQTGQMSASNDQSNAFAPSGSEGSSRSIVFQNKSQRPIELIRDRQRPFDPRLNGQMTAGQIPFDPRFNGQMSTSQKPVDLRLNGQKSVDPRPNGQKSVDPRPNGQKPKGPRPPGFGASGLSDETVLAGGGRAQPVIEPQVQMRLRKSPGPSDDMSVTSDDTEVFAVECSPSADPDKKCKTCRKTNHTEEDCYFRLKKQSSSVKGPCKFCGMTNHLSEQCFKGDNALSCVHCGKSGHLPKYCFKRPGAPTCEKCGKPGHLTEKCFSHKGSGKTPEQSTPSDALVNDGEFSLIGDLLQDGSV